MSERLKRIKSDWHEKHTFVANNVPWLIKQAERVKKLEEENDKLKQQVDFWKVEDNELMRLL